MRVLDSSASHYMSLDSLSFASLSPMSSMSIMIADVTPIPLANAGFVITPHLSFFTIYHILNLTLNLVSVGQLCDSNYLISFSFTSCFV